MLREPGSSSLFTLRWMLYFDDVCLVASKPDMNLFFVLLGWEASGNSMRERPMFIKDGVLTGEPRRVVAEQGSVHHFYIH